MKARLHKVQKLPVRKWGHFVLQWPVVLYNSPGGRQRRRQQKERQNNADNECNSKTATQAEQARRVQRAENEWIKSEMFEEERGTGGGLGTIKVGTYID